MQATQVTPEAVHSWAQGQTLPPFDTGTDILGVRELRLPQAYLFSCQAHPVVREDYWSSLHAPQEDHERNLLNRQAISDLPVLWQQKGWVDSTVPDWVWRVRALFGLPDVSGSELVATNSNFPSGFRLVDSKAVVIRGLLCPV